MEDKKRGLSALWGQLFGDTARTAEKSSNSTAHFAENAAPEGSSSAHFAKNTAPEGSSAAHFAKNNAPEGSSTAHFAKNADNAATPAAHPALRSAKMMTLLRRAAGGVCYVALGFILGGCRFAFGTYPLGIAAICAAPRGVALICAGAVAAAFATTELGGLLTGAYLIALALRILARLLLDRLPEDAEAPPSERIRAVIASLFGESTPLRMTAGSICSFLVSLRTLVSGGFHYYDMFGAIFAILFTPLAVLLLSWCGTGVSDCRGWQRTLGRGALMCALSFSLRASTLMGISVAVFGIFFTVLYISSHKDTVRGAAVGLVCGVAYDPITAPIFVMAAAIVGLLGRISLLLSVGTALTAGLLWGLYMDGLDALTRLLPALVLSSAAYYGAARVGWLEQREAQTAQVSFSAASERIVTDEERILDISGAFSSLSQIFYELSDRVRRPGLLDLRRVCDTVFDRHCPGCPRRETCWGLEYGLSLDMLARLATALGEHGRALPELLPEHTRARCRNIALICREINTEVGRLTEAVLRSEKLSLFALDYEAISRLLSDAVEQQRREYGRAEALTVSAGRTLEALGLSCEISVWGERRRVIRVSGLDPEQARLESGQLRRCLESAVGCRLEEPAFTLSGGRVEATLSTRRCCSAAHAQLCLPFEEGAPCGDSVKVFEDGHDRFYALLSDGMGSGSEAAFCSGLVTVFLEKMLSAGNGVETSLRMLNSVLRSKGGAWESECSATVDLLTLDLLSGQAALIKSGAAPTYVRRGNDIFRLRSETVPLGILNAIDARRTVVELLPRDVVIMVSDGVSDAAIPLPGAPNAQNTARQDAQDTHPGAPNAQNIARQDAQNTHPEQSAPLAHDEQSATPAQSSAGNAPYPPSAEWLEDLLSLEWDDDLDLMARRIVGRAQSVGGRDDLSVILVRVEEY